METPELRFQPVYEDERGLFSAVSLWNINDRLMDKRWLQVNTSVSDHKYTLRGLHLQLEPFEQTKYLTVIKGKVLDFVVNCNEFSKDYGKIHVFEVDKDHAVYVPRGYAHGVLTLEDNTVLQYLTDNLYNPEKERSVLWSSVSGLEDIIKEYLPHFKPSYLTISEKDQNGINFSDVKLYAPVVD
jgi:dTDP-4-dehydrorhamnose 3,5-epimerase